MSLGSVRSTKSIRYKIAKLIESYQNAVQVIDQSGGGLTGASEVSFYDMIHKKYCKYYSELHEVLQDRPTTFAAFTNEMSDDQVNEALRKCDEESVDDNSDPREIEVYTDCSDDEVESVYDSSSRQYIDKKNESEEDNSISQRSTNDSFGNNDNDVNSNDLEVSVLSDQEMNEITSKISKSLSIEESPSKKRRTNKHYKISSSESTSPAKAKRKLHLRKRKSRKHKASSSIKQNELSSSDDDDKHMVKICDIKEETLKHDKMKHKQSTKLEVLRMKFEKKRIEMHQTKMNWKKKQHDEEMSLKKQQHILQINENAMKLRQKAKEEYSYTDEEVKIMYPFAHEC